MKRKILLIVCLLLTLVGCNSKKLEIKDQTIELEEKFGGIYIHKTIDEFFALGFELGDSVDIKFSNGFELIDIPFYDGYYADYGMPLIVAYPGYPYIDLANNYGQCIYEQGNIDESMTATITLNTKGKYLNVQETYKIVYTDNRNDYGSDEIFANFRCIEIGNLKDSLIYRAASPCDNQHNRAPYVSKLCEENSIKTYINLADNEEEIRSYYEDENLDCGYWKQGYENGHVFPFDFSANYRSEGYIIKISDAMKVIINNEGPYLIHCTEGKDRTGFVCALIEALTGASFDEIKDDYMITYDNYYGVNKETEPDRYNDILALMFSNIVCCIANVDKIEDVNEQTLLQGAKTYLLASGLTDNEINILTDKLTK